MDSKKWDIFFIPTEHWNINQTDFGGDAPISLYLFFRFLLERKFFSFRVHFHFFLLHPCRLDRLPTFCAGISNAVAIFIEQKLGQWLTK